MTTTTRTTATRRRSEGEASAKVVVEDVSRQGTIPAPGRGLQQQGLNCNGGDYLDSINANGFPHCYSCYTEPPAEVQLIRIAYDYEVAWDGTTAGESFVQDILPQLEWGQLITVATQFYLPSCQLERQAADVDNDLTILGVSSLYLDFRDVQVSGCEFLQSAYNCTPVAGSMTAEYTGGNASVASARLLAAVEAVMASNHGISAPVKDLLFVGDRLDYRQTYVAGTQSAQESGRDGNQNTSIVTSAAAVGFIGLLAGAALLLRRKRNHPPPKPRHIVVAAALREDLENPPPAKGGEVRRDLELPSSPPRCTTASESGSVLPDTEDASMVPLEDVPLPYLPPAVAGGMIMEPLGNLVLKSETLRKRRKRKKKKIKKVTLVRVNSRENVASMETISETDEAEPQEDLDSEDFKEGIGPSATYSTSDDESSVASSAASDDMETDGLVEEHTWARSPGRRKAPGLPPFAPVAI